MAVPQQQIVSDFHALSTLPSVGVGRHSLQGYDNAIRLALREAADNVSAEGQSATAVHLYAGTATLVRPGEATVPFRVTFTSAGPPHESSSDHFSAVALEVHHRWLISWTTMCLLVEADGDICPSTPKGIAVGDILPGPGRAPSSLSLTQGLVDPGALAAAPLGGVFIADDGRNQILRWNDGALSVVAGTGLQGYSGDGGPAIDAELNDPGELAVGPNGTLYFVDQGNHRVRAVAVNGMITTVAGDGSVGNGADVGDGGLATDTPLDPSGVAVGPTGTLWVSSDNAIREIEPDGIISTRIKAGGPYGVAVTTTNGAQGNFSPGSLALNGQGQLVVFSFDTKELYAVDPDGQVVDLGQNYASALSSAPDGTVLIAEHGPGIDDAAGTHVATFFTPSQMTVPSVAPPLVADGIAETSDGTVYIDTHVGDGYNVQSGLDVIEHGNVRFNAISTPPLANTSSRPSVPPASAATTYPATVATKSSTVALSRCPSSQGVVPFDGGRESRGSPAMLAYWNTGFSYDLHASDRAWWPGVVAKHSSLTVGWRAGCRWHSSRPSEPGSVWAADRRGLREPVGKGLAGHCDGAIGVLARSPTPLPVGSGRYTAGLFRRLLSSRSRGSGIGVARAFPLETSGRGVTVKGQNLTWPGRLRGGSQGGARPRRRPKGPAGCHTSKSRFVAEALYERVNVVETEKWPTDVPRAAGPDSNKGAARHERVEGRMVAALNDALDRVINLRAAVCEEPRARPEGGPLFDGVQLLHPIEVVARGMFRDQVGREDGGQISRVDPRDGYDESTQRPSA